MICFSFWLFFRLFGLLFFVFIFLFGIFPHSRSLVKGICTVFVLAILASKLNLAAFLLYRLWVSLGFVLSLLVPRSSLFA